MNRRPLTPVETASAGILGGLAIAVIVLGTAISGGAGGPLNLLAAVPLAILAHQQRARAVVAATVAVCVVSAVAGGIPSVTAALLTVATGVVVGWLRRRGLGWAAAVASGLVLGIVAAAVTVGMLLLFDETRRLFLESLRSSIDGSFRMLDWFTGHLGGSGSRTTADRLAQARVTAAFAILRYWASVLVDLWAWWVAATTILSTLASTLVAYALSGVVLRRLRLTESIDPLVGALAEQGAVGPLPVRLAGVSFRYPDAPREALQDVDLLLAPGETVALVGPNGSGKSTLATILAGATPTSGTVERPGTAGLGRPGGTALLAQRTELQLLGETLADDVRWGVDDEDVDVSGLLDLVGLGGREAESPSTLSGGELQRLALAGALARRPALLVSDESTAMVDPEGRAELMAVLRDLPRRLGTTVVHVTHDPAEAAGLDRLVRIDDGRVVADTRLAPSDPPAAPAPLPPVDLPPPGPVALTLSGVGHTYAPGTPWEREALRGIDLELRAGEGVLVTGTNGSGKTTLARIMAGLLTPTAGWCESIPYRPMRATVGRVALAMQFSRLQLRRPTVGEDLLDAVNLPAHQPLLPDEREVVERGLATVGLPPELADRDVDRLSGGQMRRVALTGLLGTQPAVLVLDEPFAGLDAESRVALTRTLETELRRGLALVVITHDVHGLESLCRRRLVLDGGSLR